MALFLSVVMPVSAGRQLDLKSITQGEFRPEGIAAVEPLADGESYAQITKDGKQIVRYSFRTGKQAGVLFDANTARGAKVDRVEGYIVSPDGKRLLIQTGTKSIYRQSFTATY